jgi:hypothetical protein
MKEKNRFDLEQEILECWRVVEDIKTITEMYDSGRSEDEVLNALIGIRALYEQKFSTLFDTFEACLVKKQFRE